MFPNPPHIGGSRPIPSLGITFVGNPDSTECAATLNITLQHTRSPLAVTSSNISKTPSMSLHRHHRATGCYGDYASPKRIHRCLSNATAEGLTWLEKRSVTGCRTFQWRMSYRLTKVVSAWGIDTPKDTPKLESASASPLDQHTIIIDG